MEWLQKRGQNGVPAAMLACVDERTGAVDHASLRSLISKAQVRELSDEQARIAAEPARLAREQAEREAAARAAEADRRRMEEERRAQAKDRGRAWWPGGGSVPTRAPAGQAASAARNGLLLW